MRFRGAAGIRHEFIVSARQFCNESINRGCTGCGRGLHIRDGRDKSVRRIIIPRKYGLYQYPMGSDHVRYLDI